MPRKSTRNAQGGGSIRQRKDGTWEGRYTVGRDPGTGKQVQKSVYGTTQSEVRKKLQQITTQIDEGTYTEPSKLTVGGWLDTWVALYTGHLKERTLNLYTGTISTRIKPALGAVRLISLNAPAIQKFYNDLGKGENPLSPKTVKNVHGIFHKALEQAVAVGYIRINPADACQLPRTEKPDIKPLDKEAITRFFETVKDTRYERPLIVDLFTGLRLSEIIALTWDCISFEKGTIYVYRQLQLIKGQYKFGSLKNDKTRTISPAPFIMRMLKKQRQTQNEWRLAAGAAWADGNFVFTDEIGDHLKQQTLYKNLKRVVAKIGLPSTRFHDLRHSYAVASIQSGDDIKTIQENLGHHAAAFTLDIYGHVTEQMKKDSAMRMETFIQDVIKP